MPNRECLLQAREKFVYPTGRLPIGPVGGIPISKSLVVESGRMGRDSGDDPDEDRINDRLDRIFDFLATYLP